jgi:hypothetical protein
VSPTYFCCLAHSSKIDFLPPEINLTSCPNFGEHYILQQTAYDIVLPHAEIKHENGIFY